MNGGERRNALFPSVSACFSLRSGGLIMEKQWYFTPVPEQPELGMISPASHRMGPYRTREDALDAWKIVQERNLKWEEQDREWKRWSADGSASSEK
nr:MAG TPA: protein of unknown function (DUF4170) [Caudoviricetes sp.]